MRSNREHISITGDQSLSKKANEAMFAKGNPEADWRRGVISSKDTALSYHEWRDVFDKLEIKPITSVLLRGQIQRVENLEKAEESTSCEFVLEEVQISQPNEEYNHQVTMEIPGEIEKDEVDSGFIILPSKGRTTNLDSSRCMGIFSKPEQSRQAAAEKDKVQLDWKGYLKSILPDDKSKDIRQSLESMAGQSIFNNFIYHLVSKYEKDSKTYPFKPHIQMVIKNESGSAGIECMFFAFAENVISEDHQFRVRDENDQHNIMGMDTFEEYQQELDKKMRTLSNHQKIDKILAEIHTEKDHHQEPTQIFLLDTEDSDEDEQEKDEKGLFSRCTIC
ncbi:MAG: hypothetical protein VX737_03005 [Pseudomonadota bacterium]|nr:hypothetical protein [Pseudomonadota bacterium]